MGKLNPTEVKFWLQEMSSCEERWTKEVKNRNFYPHLINYYEGWTYDQAADPAVVKQRKLAIINDHFPNTNAKITEILFKNPDVLVTATKNKAMTPNGEVFVEDGVPLMKGALDYAVDETELLIENRLGTFDMLFAGYCGVEVDHIINNDAENSMLNVDRDSVPKRKGLMETVKDKLKLGATDQEQAAENLQASLPPVEANYATNEHTYVKRYPPENIIFDWRAERLKERRYQPKKVYLSKAEFDRRYPDFKDKVKAGNEIDYTKHDNEQHSKSVLLYEIQVPVGKDMWTIVITPSWTLSEIDMWKRPYTTEGFNLKIGTLHKYGKIYPIALAMINKAMSDEMNNYVRFMMDVAERNIPKLLYDGNKIKSDGVEALRSKVINDVIKVEGAPQTAVFGTTPTRVSNENKELMGIFEKQKTQGWAVSANRLQQPANAEFATELQIQEAGFQEQSQDIQEGLRQLMKEELKALKDIIVQFWDGEYFFKVTGGQKPQWYEPVTDPATGIVLNPLTDLLTGDYFIDTDMASALRPNPERRKNELIVLFERMLSPVTAEYLASKGLSVSIEFLNKIMKKHNLDPENVFEQLEPQAPPPPEPLDMGETKVEQTEKVADEMGNEKEVKTTDTTKKYDMGEEPQMEPEMSEEEAMMAQQEGMV